MDLSGLAGILAVPFVALTAIGAFWPVISDRSQLRVLERLSAIGEKLPAEYAALHDVRALQNGVAAELLGRWRLRGRKLDWILLWVSLLLLVLASVAVTLAFDSTPSFHRLVGPFTALYLVAGLLVGGTGLVVYLVALSRSFRRMGRSALSGRPGRLSPPST